MVLGAVDRPLTLIHLQKEVFLLWNFHSGIRSYLKFIKHYRGPFSKEIQETVQNPIYLEGYWKYIPPKKGDKLSGGYVELTPLGREEYKRLLKKMEEKEELLHLLSGIKMVRQLYDKLSLEELLLLIYDTYPEYIERSDVYKSVEKKKAKIVENLKRKGFIDAERYLTLLGKH